MFGIFVFPGSRTFPTGNSSTSLCSRACPEGVNRRHSEILTANHIFFRFLLLFVVMRRRSSRGATLEQPAFALAWWLVAVISFLVGTVDQTDSYPDEEIWHMRYNLCPLQLKSLLIVERAACRIYEGAAAHRILRKQIRFLVVRARWLLPLNQVCDGHHCHWQPHGSSPAYHLE